MIKRDQFSDEAVIIVFMISMENIVTNTFVHHLVMYHYYNCISVVYHYYVTYIRTIPYATMFGFLIIAQLLPKYDVILLGTLGMGEGVRAVITKCAIFKPSKLGVTSGNVMWEANSSDEGLTLPTRLKYGFQGAKNVKNFRKINTFLPSEKEASVFWQGL